MNQLVIAVLIVYGLAWLIYIAGLRDKRVAFGLWFPVTLTSLLGTLLWLWVVLGLLTAPKSGDAATGFAAMGAAILLGVLLICPIVLAVSIWQRPKPGAYGLVNTLPIILFYFALLFLYRPLSQAIENQKLQLVVLDTRSQPVANARVHYETSQKTLHMFSFPASPMTGEVETDSNGTAILPVPRTHEIDCEVKKEGYATLRIRMNRAWGLSEPDSRQTSIDWQFPPDDPKKPWEYHGGSVGTDVDDSRSMQLSVYLPQTKSEAIPAYGPVRIYQVGMGKVSWMLEASKVRSQ